MSESEEGVPVTPELSESVEGVLVTPELAETIYRWRIECGLSWREIAMITQSMHTFGQNQIMGMMLCDAARRVLDISSANWEKFEEDAWAIREALLSKAEKS
jgi:hypothetical protein